MTPKKVPVAVLKDVVAYVDVWSTSKTENYSDPFIQQLRDMGAQVCKTFNKQVTHVVFKHGHQATWNKAKKMGVKMVSVHWVARCKENGEHADEDLYPAHNEESQLNHLKKRTHRCMQPRDVPPSTPKRLKKKLEKMMEKLVRSSPIVTDAEPSPFIIDEENGIVYSPSSRRADTMAQRLREMREQRENLSPTASQQQGSPMDDSTRPSLGNTPTDFNILLMEEEEAPGCLSRASEREEGVKDHHEKISTNRISSSGMKDAVPLPENKTRSRSCSGVTQQPPLDYVHPVSAKQSASHVLSEPKARAPEEPRPSSGNREKSQIRSSLSRMKSRGSQIPQATEELKRDSDSGDWDETHFPKFARSLKSSDLKIHKARRKNKQTDFDAHSDNDDVFDDYFTSADGAPKRKVPVTRSASEAERLPSFDLEPLNRSRRKSHSQEIGSRKSKPLNDGGITEASGLPEEELLAASVGASLPVPDQEPAAKKPRTRTKQNSISESKDD